MLHPRTGAFTWQTGEAHGPGAYRFTVAVTDNGVPPLSSSVPVEIVVQEVNQPPVITPLRDMIVNEGAPLAVQIVARDDDLPRQPLTFRLLSPVPPGMAISAAGLITWTPDEFQRPAWHRVTVVVSDGVAEATASFRVFVRDVRPDFTLRAGASRVFAGQAGSLPLSLAASLDVAVSFRLHLRNDETAAGISGLRLVPGAGRFAALSLAPAGDLTYEVAMTLAPGAAQDGPQEARLEFDARADTPSGIVRFELRDVVAEAAGRLLSRPAVRDGCLVVIHREPVLELLRDAGLRLRLQGHPDGRYTIEYRQRLDADDSGQMLEQVTLDGAGLLDRPSQPPEGASTLFLRARDD